jgi:uncharacterized protein (DUF1778 family)
MDTRIQFRVDEEIKRLAQQMAENQGRTLSDALIYHENAYILVGNQQCSIVWR